VRGDWTGVSGEECEYPTSSPHKDEAGLVYLDTGQLCKVRGSGNAVSTCMLECLHGDGAEGIQAHTLITFRPGTSSCKR
jgi:hypothetical protein